MSIQTHLVTADDLSRLPEDGTRRELVAGEIHEMAPSGHEHGRVAMKFAWPLTHDLAATIVRGLGGDLQRVIITRVQENTYYAEMVISRGTEMFSIDTRPSDSIAIALRLQARLFTNDELLSNASIQIETASEEEPEHQPESEGTQMTAEQLQEYLKKLKPEDLGRFKP